MNVVFDPIWPLPLVLLLGGVLVALTVYLYWRIGTHVTKVRTVFLLVFRLLGIALVMALLLQPSRFDIIPPPRQDKVTLVAVDTSLSMKQTDADSAARLDAAKNLLMNADVVSRAGALKDARVRLFQFGEDAAPVIGSSLDLSAHGKTTRFHKSVTTMLSTLGGGVRARALVLLTDGHDFELVNPAQTGSAARARQVPIYAIPFGNTGKVRDVAAHITSYQPYCYVKQKARLTASLRLIGCEFEDLRVELLRHNQVVQTRRVNADQVQELPVEFDVMEPEIGQYEYEIRVLPLPGEVDTSNNSAITYLNVINQQIQVLVLEGSPYWDTTFLQRSLMRNDKFNVDSLVKYGDRRVRPIRKHEEAGPLTLPETPEQFRRYDVIILGRAVDQMLNRSQIALLTDYARTGGTVIFSRGPAFTGEADNELEPVIWGQERKEAVHLQPSREGAAASPFRALSDEGTGVDDLPAVLSARDTIERKPLTATLALAAPRDGNAPVPGMVHRRFGEGQVVSIGVEGLWRWGLNPKVEGMNSAFDRFWDQMILWLQASRDFVPAKQFSLRTSSANIQLGEKVYFRLLTRTPDPSVKTVPLRLYLGDKEIARTVMTANNPQEPMRLTAEFLPQQIGKYRVVASFPDGTSQDSRFIVFTDNREETEVATDVASLKRLCESSGGRLLAPQELGKLLTEFRNETVELTPQTKLTPLWDQTWVFYVIGLLFGTDWFLRRRWGLS